MYLHSPKETGPLCVVILPANEDPSHTREAKNNSIESIVLQQLKQNEPTLPHGLVIYT